VLIESTAPGLFDVKPTPLSGLHLGVEILATLKEGDYLHYPKARSRSALLPTGDGKIILSSTIQLIRGGVPWPT